MGAHVIPGSRWLGTQNTESSCLIGTTTNDGANGSTRVRSVYGSSRNGKRASSPGRALLAAEVGPQPASVNDWHATSFGAAVQIAVEPNEQP